MPWHFGEEEARATSLVAQALGEAIDVQVPSEAVFAARAQRDAYHNMMGCFDALSADAQPCGCLSAEGMAPMPRITWLGCGWKAQCLACGRTARAGTHEGVVRAWDAGRGAE